MNESRESELSRLFADEADSQIDEWTLDEIEDSADLGALHAQGFGADDDWR